jgi:hypothetical protein
MVTSSTKSPEAFVRKPTAGRACGRGSLLGRFVGVTLAQFARQILAHHDEGATDWHGISSGELPISTTLGR